MLMLLLILLVMLVVLVLWKMLVLASWHLTSQLYSTVSGLVGFSADKVAWLVGGCPHSPPASQDIFRKFRIIIWIRKDRGEIGKSESRES